MRYLNYINKGKYYNDIGWYKNYQKQFKQNLVMFVQKDEDMLNMMKKIKNI
ncbi:hypothetical protein SKUN_00970 [Spiroplasma kunkelii CR2-3x]|uniref:Uncharacterized protein n=1 Tax=Spiroplasma kunkelii CR2-3x TaxID=273035 RepID=A0A0K2JHG3_SPIKU|nr:hypothetical protein SKUN_00970 [Spiroplasma kunkelii CR2-3x]